MCAFPFGALQPLSRPPTGTFPRGTRSHAAHPAVHARARLDPRDATPYAHRPAHRYRLLALSARRYLAARQKPRCEESTRSWRRRAQRSRCSCALDQGMKVSSIRHTPARVMRMQPASKSTFPASQVLDDDIFQWLGWASSSVVPEATPPASSSRCRSQSGRNRLAAAQEGLSRR